MSKIQVSKQGKTYLLNGEVVHPRDFIGGEAFKGINHIAAWVFGGAYGEGGGVHLDRFRRYLEEDIVGNGLRRCRLPLELMFWGPPYFNLPSHPNIANTQEWFDLYVGTGSSFHFTTAFKMGLRMAINLAREFDLVFEIIPLWTIKGPGEDDPREDIGAFNEHVVGNEDNGLGAYLHLLKAVGDGEGEHRVDPGPLNLLVDVMNEYKAHSVVWTQSQLQNVAKRWHERDNPGELVMISQSGKKYEPPLATYQGSRGFDTVCLHPPRDDDWTQTGTIIRQAWPNELIDFNESMMAWTEEDAAYWLPLVPKWAGLATTDLVAWEAMVENFLDNGVYVTLHTKRGMDGAFPPTPQTVVEETIRSLTGASGPGPGPGPEPEPPPEGTMKIVRNDNAELVIERDPEVIVGGDEANILRDRIEVTIPAGRRLERLHTFHGLDRGDIVEIDTEIHANGKTLYVRSDHKEIPCAFDAWESWEPRDSFDQDLGVVDIAVLCRVNGENETLSNDAIDEHRDGNRLTARPHFGIRLVFK